MSKKVYVHFFEEPPKPKAMEAPKKSPPRGARSNLPATLLLAFAGLVSFLFGLLWGAAL